MKSLNIQSILYLTGPKYSNIKMRTIAKSKGYKLNQYSLSKDSIIVGINNEKEIFNILNVKYLPPEKREYISI